jgi:hypothetical protein
MRSPNGRLAAASVTFIVAAVAGFAAAQERNSSIKSEEGAGTYLASGVSVSATEDSPSGKPPQAVVSYSMSWSGSEFPGYALCRAEIRDSDGDIIGEQEFEFFSLIPEAQARQLPIRIDEGSAPATAETECAEAHLPSESASYVISAPDVQTVLNPGDVRLTFDVAWATNEPPLYQRCVASFTLTDGSSATFEFGLSVGPGRADVLLGDRFVDSTVSSVTCNALGAKGA